MMWAEVWSENEQVTLGIAQESGVVGTPAGSIKWLKFAEILQGEYTGCIGGFSEGVGIRLGWI